MIDMQVRSETGEVLASGSGFEWGSATAADLDPSTFPLLLGICPYENTVFNSWQRPLLLAELDRLPPERQGPWVEKLRGFCRLANETPHRYVWLIGD